MEYKVGERIHDPEGNEWLITSNWEYKDCLCLSLIGTSNGVLGQLGGLKIEYKEGGLTIKVR